MNELKGPYDYLRTLCYDEIVLYQFHSPWLDDVSNNMSSRKKKSMGPDDLMQGILGEENQIDPTSLKLGNIVVKQADWAVIESTYENSGGDPILVRCSPEYRAGLIYYQSGEIVGSLSICFDCFGVQWCGISGYANQRFYSVMKSVFLHNGYVEQPRPSDAFYS